MLEEIRQILDKSRAQRREPGLDVWLLDSGPWWRLSTGFPGLEQTKTAILAAAWRVPYPLFLIPAEPIESELQPFVRREGEAWRVDTTKTADEFYRAEQTSVLGNWLLYAAAQPLATPPQMHSARSQKPCSPSWPSTKLCF